MQSFTESKVITGKSQTYKKTPEIVLTSAHNRSFEAVFICSLKWNKQKTRHFNELYTWAVIQLCDTGHRLPFFELPIDHNVDVHYQVKHRMYNVLDT